MRIRSGIYCGPTLVLVKSATPVEPRMSPWESRKVTKIRLSAGFSRTSSSNPRTEIVKVGVAASTAGGLASGAGKTENSKESIAEPPRSSLIVTSMEHAKAAAVVLTGVDHAGPPLNFAHDALQGIVGPYTFGRHTTPIANRPIIKSHSVPGSGMGVIR